MVVTASQLASYDTTKHWLLKLKDNKGESQFREGYLVHFVASTIAGKCGYCVFFTKVVFSNHVSN